MFLTLLQKFLMGRLLVMFVISLTAIKKSARAAQFDSAATLTNVRVHHFMLQDRFTAFPLRFVLMNECWPLFAILPFGSASADSANQLRDLITNLS